jgi:hypothetical protein
MLEYWWVLLNQEVECVCGIRTVFGLRYLRHATAWTRCSMHYRHMCSAKLPNLHRCKSK